MEIRRLHLAFFSPTLSTRNCLGNIARGIFPTGGNTCFHNLTFPAERGKKIEIPENELLIIGMPVYAGRVPALFHGGLNITGRGSAVCVVVYGNRGYDDALVELVDLTRRNGFNAVAAAAFISQHSLNPAIARGRPDTNDIRKQIAFGREIGRKIADTASLAETPPLSVRGNPDYKPYRVTVTVPQLIPRLCISCRICAGACPVQIIDYDNFGVGAPEKCIFCNACRVLCPRQARELPEPQRTLFEQRMGLLEQSYTQRKESEIFI